MNDYYVHKEQDKQGDHEVHISGCSWMVNVENFIYLGSFDDCVEAVKAAKKHYSKVNGCIHCSKKCNTS